MQETHFGVTEVTERFWRVDADFGDGRGMILVGETTLTRTKRQLMAQAWESGAKEVAVYLCDRF